MLEPTGGLRIGAAVNRFLSSKRRAERADIRRWAAQSRSDFIRLHPAGASALEVMFQRLASEHLDADALDGYGPLLFQIDRPPASWRDAERDLRRLKYMLQLHEDECREDLLRCLRGESGFEPPLIAVAGSLAGFHSRRVVNPPYWRACCIQDVDWKRDTVESGGERLIQVLIYTVEAVRDLIDLHTPPEQRDDGGDSTTQALSRPQSLTRTENRRNQGKVGRPPEVGTLVLRRMYENGAVNEKMPKRTVCSLLADELDRRNRDPKLNEDLGSPIAAPIEMLEDDQVADARTRIHRELREKSARGTTSLSPVKSVKVSRV